jgi:dienelactone hydrolase
MAHPSFVDEEELLGFKAPLSIAAAQVDDIFPAEKRHRSEELLIQKGDPWQINLFSGVEHGFSVRCDLSVPHQKWAKEQAFYQAIQWFDQYLA